MIVVDRARGHRHPAGTAPLYDRSAFEEHRAGERAAFTRPEDTYWER